MNRTRSIPPTKHFPATVIARTVVSIVVVFVGLVVSIPKECFTPEQVIDSQTGILDLSCATEPALRWKRGEYAGRDFIFTYGPLSQIIHGAFLARGTDDVATVMRWHALLPPVITNVALWFVLATTGAPLSWRVPAYLLWLLIWPYFFIKPIGGLLVIIMCGYLLESAKFAWRATGFALWALGPAVLMMHVFDLGVVTFASLFLSVPVALAWTWGLQGAEVRQARRRLITAVLALGVGVALLATTALVTNPFQSYLRDSWEIAKGYSQTMAVPIETRYLAILAAAIAGSIALGVFMGLRWRHGFGGEPKIRGRTLGLLAAACYCLVITRYGMTRSDTGHVQAPVGTLVCVAGCFLPCYLRGSNRDSTWPALLVWGPATLLASWAFLDHLGNQVAAAREFRLDAAKLNINHDTLRDAIDTAKKLPEDSLYIWPYESIVGQVANKKNPAYTLQAFAAHTPYLEDKTIERLQQDSDAPVMYFVNTYPLEEVEHLTRTPRIFRYLLENYAISGPRHGDFLLLRRQDGRPTQWAENEITRPERGYNPGADPPMTIELPADKSGLCSASDLLILRLSAIEPQLLRLPKPGNLYLTLSLSNGEKKKQRILVPADGTPHDIIVSACNAEQPVFWSIFHPTRMWRAIPRVTGIQLEWVPMDSLSQRPTKITLHSVKTLRRPGAEVRETALAEAHHKELLNWLFGTPDQPFQPPSPPPP